MMRADPFRAGVVRAAGLPGTEAGRRDGAEPAAPPDEVASSSGEASAAAAAAPPATFQEKSAAQIIEMIGEKIEEMAVGGDEGDEAEGEVPGLQAAPPAAPTPADDNLEDLD